jgi:hypothetical protein
MVGWRGEQGCGTTSFDGNNGQQRGMLQDLSGDGINVYTLKGRDPCHEDIDQIGVRVQAVIWPALAAQTLDEVQRTCVGMLKMVADEADGPVQTNERPHCGVLFQ